jgi:hypothetical protein
MMLVRIHMQAGGCVARTQHTSSDDIGFTYTEAGGRGFGEAAGWSLYYEISTCNTLPCLSSWFAYAGWGYYDGIGGGLTVFWGNWNRYGFPTTFGADIGIALGDGVQAWAGFSYTWVWKFTCGSNWACSAAANYTRFVWDAATSPVRWLVNSLYQWVSWAKGAANWFIRHGY